MPVSKPNDRVDKNACARKIAQFGEKLQAGGFKQAASTFNVRQSNIKEKEAVTQLHYHYNKTAFSQIITATYDDHICFREFVTNPNRDPFFRIKNIWTNAVLLESPVPFKTGKMHLFGSDFQCNVWKSLLLIEKGELASYSQIAKLLGKPQATRAVASAIAANKIAVSIPCHRIIRTNGDIGDFKWGKGLKQHLIEGEHTGELFL